MTKYVRFLSGYALLFKVSGPTVGPMVVNQLIIPEKPVLGMNLSKPPDTGE